MKITKIKTNAGSFGAPVTVELDAVVERMRSPKTKEIADRIAAVALSSRIAIEQGTPRYQLLDNDKLPYLVFSTVFKQKSLDKIGLATGLLLLSIPCPQGHRQVEELKRRVSQIPYTMLAFAGVSGVTLKVVVRCDYTGESEANAYLAFLKEAHENAARLYTSLIECNLLVSEQTLTRGCRLSYDLNLYYNAEALPMPVVRKTNDPLAAYEGTKADDDGTVVQYPDHEERQRIELEYQTCLSKAIDDGEGQAEKTLQMLADTAARPVCRRRVAWSAPPGISVSNPSVSM